MSRPIFPPPSLCSLEIEPPGSAESRSFVLTLIFSPLDILLVPLVSRYFFFERDRVGPFETLGESFFFFSASPPFGLAFFLRPRDGLFFTPADRKSFLFPFGQRPYGMFS